MVENTASMELSVMPYFHCGSGLLSYITRMIMMAVAEAELSTTPMISNIHEL